MPQPVAFTFGNAFNQALARRQQLDQRREETFALRQIQLQGLAQQAQRDQAQQQQAQQAFQLQEDQFAEAVAANRAADRDRDRDFFAGTSLRSLKEEAARGELDTLARSERLRGGTLNQLERFAAGQGEFADIENLDVLEPFEITKAFDARFFRGGRGGGGAGRADATPSTLLALHDIDLQLKGLTRPEKPPSREGFSAEDAELLNKPFREGMAAFNKTTQALRGARRKLLGQLQPEERRSYLDSFNTPEAPPGGAPQLGDFFNR